MIDRDKLYLLYLKKYCSRIIDCMNEINYSYDIFLSNDDIKDIVSFNLLQIGELIKLLSDETINKLNCLPLKEIIGMRNIIVHHYNKIDYEIIYNTCVKDISNLLSKIENELKDVDDSSNKLDIDNIVR